MEIIDITPISTEENPLNAYYIEEAAVRLRMSVKSVRRQIIRGNLRRCGKFGKILIPRKDVDTYFERTAVYV